MKGAGGTTDTWAVEGDGTDNLVAAGWDLKASGWDFKSMLRPGDVINITALPAKAGAKLADTLVFDKTATPGFVAAMNSVVDRQRADRLMHGVDVTLPDGRKLLFGEAGR